MDLSQLLRAVRRRWYIVLPLTLITIIVAFVVRAGVQPGYTVTASVIVLPPGAARIITPEGVQVQSVNPLLSFNSSTQVAGQALAILAAGPEFQARVTAGSDLATYSVTAPPREPILNVLVESKDRDVALDVGGRVITELGAELDRQQPVQRPEERLSIQTLAQPGVAEVDNSQIRALVVTLAIGLLLTLVATILVDGIATRKARPGRRHASSSTSPAEEAGRPDASVTVSGPQGRPQPGDGQPGALQPESR